MFDKIMTKDTEKLLCLLYKMYLERINSGVSKYDAIYFANYSSLSNEIHKTLDSEEYWFCINEFKKIGFTQNYTDGGIRLLFPAIAYMENRCGKNILDVIDTISKFIP